MHCPTKYTLLFPMRYMYISLLKTWLFSKRRNFEHVRTLKYLIMQIRKTRKGQKAVFGTREIETLLKGLRREGKILKISHWTQQNRMVIVILWREKTATAFSLLIFLQILTITLKMFNWKTQNWKTLLIGKKFSIQTGEQRFKYKYIFRSYIF